MKALLHDLRALHAAYRAEVSRADDVADIVSTILLLAGAIALAIGILFLIGGSHG